ncbi:MAG: hypothetical protein ACOY9Y_11795 [Bacillota bacterium]
MSEATNYSLIYRGLKANFILGFIMIMQFYPLPSIIQWRSRSFKMSKATNYSLIYRGLKANFMLGFIGSNQILFLAEHIPPL